MRFVSAVCRSLCFLCVVVCEACQMPVSIMFMADAPCDVRKQSARDVPLSHCSNDIVVTKERLAGVSRIVWWWRWHRHVNTEAWTISSDTKIGSRQIQMPFQRNGVVTPLPNVLRTEYVKWQEARVHRSWHRAFCHDAMVEELAEILAANTGWNQSTEFLGNFALIFRQNRNIRNRNYFRCSLACCACARIECIISSICWFQVISWPSHSSIGRIHCFHVMSMRPCINFEIVFTCRVFFC